MANQIPMVHLTTEEANRLLDLAAQHPTRRELDIIARRDRVAALRKRVADRRRSEEAPTFSNCVIGFRRWKVNGWTLGPCHSSAPPWKPGVNKASCNVHFADALPHSVAPAHGCECGLYALHSLKKEEWSSTWDSYEGQLVVGAVAAWGRMELHWEGFRAEYAQIVAISADPATVDVDTITKVYGVPNVPLELLEREALRHGEILPKTARPERPNPNVGTTTYSIHSASGGNYTISWSTGPAVPSTVTTFAVPTAPSSWVEVNGVKWQYNFQADTFTEQSTGYTLTRQDWERHSADIGPHHFQGVAAATTQIVRGGYSRQSAKFQPLPKKSSNRQGPHQKKRAPKKIGP